MKRFLKSAVTVAFIFFISMNTAFAQMRTHEWKEASEGGYTYKYVTNDPTNSRFYTLKNGLTVILSPSNKEPRIQTYIATKAGSKTDPETHTGLAHYLEHMLFKGTDKFGSKDWAKEKPLLDQIDALYERYNSTTDENKRKEIYKEIDRVSGEAAKYAIANEYDKLMSSMGAEGTNAFTSFEQTVYVENIPSNVMDKFLAVQSERFRNPILRLFHTELEAVYEEKNRGLDNDGRKAFETMFAAMFPNNNYGKQTTIGTIEHLKNPSLKAIREYFTTYYVPNNMGVIMSGDFDPTETVKKIDAAFSYMKSKAIPEYKFDPEKPITKPIVKEVYGPSAESIMLGFRFPGAGTKDAQMLTLLGNILTNGSAGMIDLNLVKSQKLLGAYAFPYVLKDYSMLILQGNPTQGQSLDEVKKLILGQIDKLKKGDFPDDLIVSIINNNKKDEIATNESYSSRANVLMESFTSELDWANELSYNDRLTQISKKDIVDFANKYLNNDNYVAVYKRKGEDKDVVKVEKPPITAVSVNREDQSDFLKKVNEMPENEIKPVWVDYSKDLQKTVSNDTEILAVKNKENELFSMYYQYNTGKWNNKLLPLAVDYLEYIGTKQKSSEDFSKEFYKLASSFNVSSSNEETYISISGLNENFAATVSLIQDLLKNAVADEEALASYKEGIKQSRANAKENKNAIMSGLRAYAKYGAKNPFNDVLTDAELDAVKASDLVKIIHDLTLTKHRVLYYGPKSVDQLAKELTPLKAKNAKYVAIPKAKIFKEEPTVKNKVLFADFDMKQAEVFWFRNSDKYNVKNAPVASLFNSYFGGGMGSIVFQTIRESKALAYSTYAYFGQASKKEDLNSVGAYVGTQADKFNDAVEGMNELLNDLPESNKALQTAKESLLKSLASERITNASILMSYLSAEKLGNKTDIRKEVYDKVPTLNYPDLKVFHDKEMKNKPYVYCVLAKTDAIKPEDLKKIGEVKTLTLKEIFGY